MHFFSLCLKPIESAEKKTVKSMGVWELKMLMVFWNVAGVERNRTSFPGCHVDFKQSWILAENKLSMNLTEKYGTSLSFMAI